MKFIQSRELNEVPEIRILLTIGWVSRVKQFRMKLYYLQCKQFQFVESMLFGQDRWAFLSDTLEIFFKKRRLSLPLEKNWPIRLR